jgi:Spirocyclase AveC-like
MATETIVGAPEPPAAAQGGRAVDGARRHAPPVAWWAGLGAISLAFLLWVMGRWVTGPDFKSVPAGPSVPPTWMKVSLIFFQVFAVVGTLALLYVYLVRPWRRERRVNTDGLLVGVFFLIWFQDPLSAIFGDWFTWNAYLWNRGSWITSVPGSQAYGRPGASTVEPLLGGFLWVWIAFAGVWFGCWVLRRSRARWPGLSAVSLIVFVLLPAMMLFDVVLEGLVAIPAGLYVYPGGHLSLFPNAYNKYPLHEAVFAGATLTCLAALRFFRDDRGETLVERGVSRMNIGTPGKTALRFLALVGVTQVATFLTYNLPIGWIAGAHSGPWPAAVQSQSYFTAHLCGAGTDRVCPRDGVPLTANDSLEIGPDGDITIRANSHAAKLYGLPPGRSLTIPSGRTPLKVVPLSTRKADPFQGTFFGTTH